MKSYIASLARTFRLDDASVLAVTAVATAVGQICAGIIPIIALGVAVYQIRIQKIRLKTERLKFQEAECDHQDKGKDKGNDHEPG
jgi:hypothetical protein